MTDEGEGPVSPADDGPADAIGGEPAAPWHRLRDLDRRGRQVAAGLALLLLLVPLVGLVVVHGHWVPQGDDALIELRALDVGTGRTPLVGQPSTSGSYGQGGDNVAHPGPIEFVALAPGLRLLGPVTGVLGTTALVSGACLVLVAWVLFRHAGPRAGAAGAALGALAAFSAGVAGLLDPLSSNAGRLPLLAGAVLVWALLCGDLRLAPLAVAVWSYAAQQHLSVLPAAAVLAVAGGVGAVGWLASGRGSDPRRLQAAWLGAGVLVGLLLWSPVLYQELTGNPGNLTALSSYSGDGERQDLGLRSAFSQVSHVLGVPPFLGRSSPKGWELVAHRSTLTVVLVLGLVALVLGAGAWWRRREPGLVAAAAMVGVLVVAGLVTGTNVPASTEQGRLNFYHWAFALSFFELLVVGWLLARLAPVVLPKLTHGRASTAAAVAAVVVAGVAVTPLVVDRRSDALLQPVPTSVVQGLEDRLGAHDALGPEGGPLLVLVNGDDRYIQLGDTLGVDLIRRGVPVVFPPSSRGFVHPDRLKTGCDVDRALVVSLLLPGVTEPPGTEVARVDAASGLDRDAYERLTEVARGRSVDLGPDLEAHLASLPGDQGNLIGAVLSLRLGNGTGTPFLSRSNLQLLLDHPIAAPALDPDDLASLLRSLPDGAATVVALEITAHLLDGDELAAYRPDLHPTC